jgi:uncharacterized protein
MPEQQTVSTEVLQTLHRIHRQLSDLKGRHNRGPKQIKAAEANQAHHKSLLEKAQTEEKSYRLTLDQKQLQLKTAEAKVKELQIKLNTAQSNREYQTLLEQIQATEMANSVMADEILEEMEKAGEYKKKVESATADLTAATQKLEEVRVKVNSQQPLVSTDIERLESELKQAESTLPAEVREPYNRVVRHLGEDALAPVENECCSGCYQHLTLNLCSQLMMNQPVFCKSCGRMLYMVENQRLSVHEDDDE